MKKILVISLMLLSIASTALAANPFIERFYAFSNRDTGTIEEVNYYLEKGGIVKDFKCLLVLYFTKFYLKVQLVLDISDIVPRTL